MRMIGLLGGMGWESTAIYYRLANEFVRDRLGGLHSANILMRSVDVPFIHLADTAADAVKAAGLTKVGLLGTIFTMEQDFYRDRLASHGIEVLVPDADARQRVSGIIYDELCLGVVSETSRTSYLDVIDRLVAEGAQGIVLGCTEIEMLIDQSHTDAPVFPTTQLHVRAAVDAALRG